MIPKQLSKLKFCRIRKQSKKPFEKDWTKKPYSYEEISKFKNENYGVLCGYHNLAVIDSDKEELTLAIEQLLPKTFSVRTGGGGTHFYYFIPELKQKIILNAGEEHIGEIQSYGQQVVGAGSLHPSGKRYEVINDVGIKEISLKELKEVIGQFMKVEEESVEKKQVGKVTKEISDLISFEELLKGYGLKKKGENWNCPFHKSEGGQCLSIDNKGIFNCFHCNKKGNIISFVSELEGITIKESLKRLRELKVEEKPKINTETLKRKLKEAHNQIIQILKEYVDLKEEYYSLIAVWIIGTYFHDEFSTYPYLFFNAMKKSGKTRTLKLISHLAKNGKLLVSMSEAVLFRTAKGRTLCIDEFERVGSKEKQTLRELLNAAYKKGIKVERLKPTKDGKYEIEEFDVFCPVVIANIWGMENVLSDRCITLILERSNKQSVTKLIENFEENSKIKNIVSQIPHKNDTCDTDTMKKQYLGWNFYVKTVTKNSDKSQKDVTESKEQIVEPIVSYVNSVNSVNSVNIYNNIYNTNLSGRDLELFLPLYIVANYCGEEVLNNILETSITITKERREIDREESRDTQLIEFVSQQENTDFISVTSLTNQFKEYIESDDKWLNNSWLGRALRRLVLIKDKHRTGKIREVKLDIEKAKQKIKMFKEPEFEEKQEKIEVQKIK